MIYEFRYVVWGRHSYRMVRGAKVKSRTMSDREEEAGLDSNAHETMSAEENEGGERTSLMVEKEVR